MMLAFFPNWLDLLDRVMSNLLDGFLLGATSTTSRVAAPGVVLSHPIYKDINRAIIYAPGSSHAYIQQNYQDITTHITK
jgi:hypothetical protein